MLNVPSYFQGISWGLQFPALLPMIHPPSFLLCLKNVLYIINYEMVDGDTGIIDD